jgi:AbrB family looped-hinge helix DNA binding protein
MVKATLTSKGQLTVPKEIRERLGLRVGDRLVFELLEEGSVRLEVERRRTLGELKGSLPARGRYPGKEAEREAARDWVVRETLGRGSS